MQQLGERGEVLQLRVAKINQLGDIRVGTTKTPQIRLKANQRLDLLGVLILMVIGRLHTCLITLSTGLLKSRFPGRHAITQHFHLVVIQGRRSSSGGIQRLVLRRFGMGDVPNGLEASFLERGQVLIVV